MQHSRFSLCHLPAKYESKEKKEKKEEKKEKESKVIVQRSQTSERLVWQTRVPAPAVANFVFPGAQSMQNIGRRKTTEL